MPVNSKIQDNTREGRIECAIKALQRNEISSIRKAASIYRVNHETLRRRLQGHPARAETVANNRNLEDDEEQTLTEWILGLAARGYPPRKRMVEDTANLLRRLRGKPPVGVNWVNNYVGRTPELQIAQSKKYDYQRAQREDPEVIKEHFQLLKNVANKYGIQDDDIYNMDEIGFLRGDIGTAKVVTAKDGPKYHIQPGDRDWMTVIECINVAKRRIPAMVVAKGKVFQNVWFDKDAGIPDDWVIAHSETGWTNDRLGYIWLTEVFDPCTKQHTKGVNRLLIMDGHSSHCSAPFEAYARENNIIPLWLPSHSSHLLQPLDVACFSSVKEHYRRGVEQLARDGQNHVDVDDFLRIYAAAHSQALSNKNIESAFKSTGIFPFNPDEVLDGLGVINPPPPSEPCSSSTNSITNTPKTVRQIEKQQRAIRHRQHVLERRSTSPTIVAMKKIAKSAKLALQASAIITEELKRSKALNAKVIKKRNSKVKYITQRENLTIKEAVELSQKSIAPPEATQSEDGDTTPKDSNRALRRCRGCMSTGHNIRTCTTR
jgi:hypothetical protein